LKDYLPPKPGTADPSTPTPGTPAFGERARTRRQRIIEGQEQGDLRVQTAGKKIRRTVGERERIQKEADE